MDENQTEKLIELIRDRPALYDKRLKEYADRSINRALWKEVCEVIIDSWSTLSVQDKTLKAKEIQQRWQNLRTCFKRELNRSKAGQLSKKRRKYIYYNQLLFLLPTMDGGAQTSTAVLPRDSTNFSHGLVEKRKCSHDRSLVNFLKKRNTKDDIDEDKSFLMSLVPSFRRMTDDQKIEAKMEFLAVIQRKQRAACSSNRSRNHRLPAASEECFTQEPHQMECNDPVRSEGSGDSWVSPNETVSPDLLEIRHFKME